MAFKRFLEDERKRREVEAAKVAEQRRTREEWEARGASTRKEPKTRLAGQDADQDVVPAARMGTAHAGGGGKRSSDRDDGYELVQLPDGPELMEPAMAASVRETLARYEEQDRMQTEQEGARRLYCERIGKRYEPPPRRYFM